MIKAVIFDYGGVIIAGGGGNEPTESLAAFLGIPEEEAAKIILSLWDDYISGRLTEVEYWQRVEEYYGKPITLDTQTMRSTWEDVAPRPEMIAFIKDLKTKDYIVGLLSNIAPTIEATIRAGGGYDLFEPCVLSCRVGYAKPGPEIYQELLKQLPGIQPQEVLFIDDQQRYLDPAHSLGIQTILAENSNQIIRDITKLL
ncbi:MAG TPA: HAD family phosphatase [Patescibacteria group bacterium]|nr:HAD family phosphatase [Patescibacteria group bacterium]